MPKSLQVSAHLLVGVELEAALPLGDVAQLQGHPDHLGGPAHIQARQLRVLQPAHIKLMIS